MGVLERIGKALHLRRRGKAPVPFVVLFKKFKSVLERNNRILLYPAKGGAPRIVPSPTANGAARSPTSAFSVALLQINVWPTTASGVTDAPANETAAGKTSVNTMYGTSASEAASCRTVIV